MKIEIDFDDATGESSLFSDKDFRLYRELFAALASQEKVKVMDYLLKARAACVDEIKRETGTSYGTVRRTIIEALIPQKLAKYAMTVKHPKRQGNEVIIYAWHDATDAEVRAAVARIPMALGLSTDRNENLANVETDCVNLYRGEREVKKGDIMQYLKDHEVEPKQRAEAAHLIVQALTREGIQVAT